MHTLLGNTAAEFILRSFHDSGGALPSLGILVVRLILLSRLTLLDPVLKERESYLDQDLLLHFGAASEVQHPSASVVLSCTARRKRHCVTAFQKSLKPNAPASWRWLIYL